LSNYHHMYTLDLDCAEPELEVQVKQEQAEDTNPEPKQGKPQYTTPPSLTFILNLIHLY
jgi:hypothetical protein